MKYERKFMPVSEFAGITGISRCYAYKLIKEGRIPHKKIGNKILIPKSYLDYLLTETDK
ncbi:helix-turn-helix domain-containing protein [Gelria sp. Kuro-4]|uniref:helix-turn-helix domain-containing protein n=1 Tax=Gelria sp. Kuro-4 TaxID=2796927 RepID=UPI001BEF66A5|nr:helix-turn-helix domain-containing protein [Gelria sp. Kuro-4]BCV23273.1 hypothetical protein kuro4_00460 [Gelria sp. Kuro-4]